MSLLSLNSPSQVSCQVHPVVIFSILDHFKRRKEGQDHVIGTLLGTIREDKLVITNCFPEAAKITGRQIVLDKPFHYKMLDMYSKINREEVVVGWYSTDDEISWMTSQIHQHMYMQEIDQEIEDAVLLTVNVNTILEKKGLAVKAFTSKIINVGEQEAIARFRQVKLDYTAYEAEKIGIDTLLNGEATSDAFDAPSTILTDVQNLTITLDKVMDTLDHLSEYVDQVRDGTVTADKAIGIALNDALGTVPTLHPKQFKHLLNQKLQSLLMISYLTNLTRTQVALSDKICSTLA